MDPALLLINRPSPSTVSETRDRAILQPFYTQFGRSVSLSGGWRYSLGDTTVYSPNCYRQNLELPPLYDSPNDGTIRGRDYDAEICNKPQWWTKPHGFLGFTPLYPDFSAPPLTPLLILPRICYSDSLRQLVPEQKQWALWKQLQSDLIESIHLLLDEFGAPFLAPAYPCSRIEASVYRRGECDRLEADILTARSWFKVWLGALSYTIAVGEAMALAINNGIIQCFFPSWIEAMVRPMTNRPFSQTSSAPTRRFDCAFVSGIRDSCVARFGDCKERAGVFVEIPDNPRDMVSIAWLIEHRVPVFYPWGKREDEIAKLYPSLKQYAPPPDATWVQRDAGPPPSSTAQLPTIERRMEVYGKWFTASSLRRSILKQSEGPQRRLQRKKREALPPTNTQETKFYVWGSDTRGDFGRRLVRDDELEGIFERNGKYGREQARYDSVFNEWDLCHDWGPPDDAQLQYTAAMEADVDGIGIEDCLQGLRSRHDTPRRFVDIGILPSSDKNKDGGTPLSHFSSSTTLGRAVTDFDLGGQVAKENRFDGSLSPHTTYASQFLGFTIPTALQGILEPGDLGGRVELKGDYRIVSKALGVKKNELPMEHTFWKSTEGCALAKFICDLSRGEYPPPFLWDLSGSNPSPLLTLPRFKWLRWASGTVMVQRDGWDNVQGRSEGLDSIKIEPRTEVAYWFDIPHSEPWFLGSRSATIALAICRMSQTSDPLSIACSLAERGIPFQTWYKSVPNNISHPAARSRPELIPFRLEDYRFQKGDYEEYVKSRRRLLDGPVGRAAVKAGGLLWRIAVEDVGIQSALSGVPNAEVLNGQRLVRNIGSAGYLVDESLNRDEIEAICGHYDLGLGTPNLPHWNTLDN